MTVWCLKLEKRISNIEQGMVNDEGNGNKIVRYSTFLVGYLSAAAGESDDSQDSLFIPFNLVIGFHFDRTHRGRVMFAATDKGIWRSDDGGQTWMEKTNDLP